MSVCNLIIIDLHERLLEDKGMRDAFYAKDSAKETVEKDDPRFNIAKTALFQKKCS